MNLICKILTVILSMLASKGGIRSMVRVHYKCRGGVYPRSNLDRFPVPEDKVNWNIEYKDYWPPFHSSSSLVGKSWADPDLDDKLFKPQWNAKDGNISRESYTGQYRLLNGFPLNPAGRTGVKGRGVLGRWGPNHAADPVVTRWKRENDGSILSDNNSQKPILQVVSVMRRDNGEWALPGGMVDPGEENAHTAVREFMEEATNALVMTDEQKKSLIGKLSELFKCGIEIYRGYVDDPRNTDNAWMETIAYHYHDETGNLTKALALKAGSDASAAQWIDAHSQLKLYASHSSILEAVVTRLNAHW